MIPKHPALQILTLYALAIGLVLVGCRGEPQVVDAPVDPAPVVTPTPIVILQQGDPDPAVLKISPDSVGFGYIQAGRKEDKLITLRNASGSAATAISYVVSDTARYAIERPAPACGTTLAPGESCNFKIVATASGNAAAPTATLRVKYQDGFAEQAFTIPLNFISSTHGKLDPTFGTGGKVRGLTTIPDHFEQVNVVETIGAAAAERIYIGGSQDVSLARLKMDGSPDPSFGAGGLAKNPTNHNLETLGIYFGAAGSVLRLGRAPGNQLFVARNKENGAVDEAFDNLKTDADESPAAGVQNQKGILYIPGVEISGDGSLNRTLEQILYFDFKNGEAEERKLIVLAKKKNSSEARLLRLPPNGGGNTAIENLALPGLADAGLSLDARVQTLGTGATAQSYLLVRGQEALDADSAGRTVLARYKNLKTLTLDSTFGTGGRVVLPRCGVGAYSTMLAGAQYIFVVLPGCIVKLKASDGTRDPNFGVNGTLALANEPDVRAVAIRSLFIYYVGSRTISAQKSVFLVGRRELTTGRKDLSFGVEGAVEIPFDSNKPKNSVGNSLAFQKDGNLLVVGTSEGIFDGTDSDAGKGNLFGAIARLLP